MQSIFPLLVFFLVTQTAPVFAESGGLSSVSYSKCIETAGGADPLIIECIGNEDAAQDKRLNEAYRKLMGKLGEARKAQLQSAQRLWLKYTQANCGFYYDPDGGTSSRIMSSECFVTAKAARANELTDLEKWQ